MLNHFENIPKITDKEFQGMVICKYCGRLVETGAFNLVNHIDHCDAYWKTVPVIDKEGLTRKAVAYDHEQSESLRKYKKVYLHYMNDDLGYNYLYFCYDGETDYEETVDEIIGRIIDETRR